MSDFVGSAVVLGGVDLGLVVPISDFWRRVWNLECSFLIWGSVSHFWCRLGTWGVHLGLGGRIAS